MYAPLVMQLPISTVTFWSVLLLAVFCDAVRLIRERGYKENTYFYHLGDGGHAYVFNTETVSSIYFKCILYEKGCHGRAILRLGSGFRHSKAHNHPPNPDLVGERHFRQNVLEECRNGRYVSFNDIVNEARRNFRYSRNVRSKMTLRRLRSSMHSARRKMYPDIPLSLRQLTQVLLQHPRISSTVDGLENMYGGSVSADDGSHHVAFFSTRMLLFMGEVKILHADGTFRARPAVPASSQCFVLVTTWRHTIIPLGWVLMERRTLSAYRAVIHLMRQLCPNLNPDIIISDWEYVQQRAWSDAFPNSQIQGCLWHLCRAFVKKASKLRLLRFRNAFPGVLKYIRKACAIALLPARYFRPGLNLIMNEARDDDIVAAYILRDFFQYVNDRWIGNVYRRNWMSLFNVLHRTNNACESHNRMLRTAVGPHRPNVFRFIEAIARLEHNAYLDVLLLIDGGTPNRSRKWQSIYNDRQLAALSEDLEVEVFHNREIGIRNFINRACHLFHNAFDQHVQQNV